MKIYTFQYPMEQSLVFKVTLFEEKDLTVWYIYSLKDNSLQNIKNWYIASPTELINHSSRLEILSQQESMFQMKFHPHLQEIKCLHLKMSKIIDSKEFHFNGKLNIGP